ncbi:MAG TPA: sulfite exporter TauE/SafE family protein [Clostridia bacterium]|nr:sulfite exporter TauE/SafE family protein [Clostridia bacterium]
MFDFTPAQWIWVIVASICVGLSKLGLSGVLTMIIPVMASIFGGRESTGILLPMLLVGDIFAVSYYKQHAQWYAIRRLLLWAGIGLIMGAVVGNYVSDRQFKIIIAISVMACVGLMIWIETKGNSFPIPDKIWFYALTGIASGFTTMVGNAATPIMSLYLMAMGFRKNDFLGTYAWFFLIINALKIPFQVLLWHNITLSNAALAAMLIPAVALGAVLGALIVKKINEKLFRYLVIVMSAFAALRLFF